MIITQVMKHKFTFNLQILMLAAILMLAPAFTLKAQTSPDFEISKNLEILSTLYKELNTNYVDGVNPSDLMKTGIDAMLDKLEDGKTYVFVEHPGLDNAELRAVSHIGYEDVAQGRQDVTTMFTSEKVKAAIIKKGVKLVSYKEALK